MPLVLDMRHRGAKLIWPSFNCVSAIRYVASGNDGVGKVKSGRKSTVQGNSNTPKDFSKGSVEESKVEEAAEGAHNAAYEAYEDFEYRVMARIGNQNRDRFRLVFFSL